jgi:uncharacterized membrane protein SirB2
MIGFVISMPVHAADPPSTFDKACEADPNSVICKNSDKSGENTKKFISTLSNTLLFILGVVAVIVIIFAGIFYATSGGDPNLVKKARDTLLYAAVGLIVAISAYAIVNFVITRFI